MINLFRFVEYDCPEDAVAAIDNMHNSEMYGRTICVEYARPPKVTINRKYLSYRFSECTVLIYSSCFVGGAEFVHFCLLELV